ncbi:alpha-latrocrustotoxin-Lt1a-like [Parasteatoda tepidariorum]|uniref:alpha-latrocrustotoxin-Lt1a-like n=1 Tax=Parasteatoda tepidariorum TaxID=114398 RepID=UPI0039BCDC3C
MNMLKRFERKSNLGKMVDGSDLNMLARFRRETDLERLARECKKLEEGMNWSDAITGFFGVAAGVAGILALPGLGMVLSGVMFGSAVGKGVLGSASIERDCGDVPFRELELRLNKTLNVIIRKLDQQTEILKDVYDTVSKTLNEIEKMRVAMDRGFERILDSIERQDVNKLVSDIKLAYNSFLISENNRRNAPKDEYVNFIEQEINDNLLFNYIKSEGKLYEALFSIISNRHAIPNDINHQNAYNALTALNFGTLTYTNIVFSLLDQYTYVSEYYYQEKDLSKFNEYLKRLIFYFTTFKRSLIDSNVGLLNKVIQILEEVQQKHNIKDAKKDLYDDIVNKTNNLKVVKQNIEKMSSQIIEDVPPKEIDVLFDTYSGNKLSKTDFLDWKRGTKVSYATQYEKDGKYSRISKWTHEDVLDIANPEIVIKNSNDKNRLVFRMFTGNKPEMIRIISGSQNKFRDIDRDLYDLAFKKSYNDNSIMQNMNKLLNLGASVSAVFASGRGVIHAAAATGRVNMLKRILEVDRKVLNQKDSKGYTPLHIAIENNRSDFVNELVKQGADVNAKTNEDNVTPLHLAVRFQSEKSVEHLLSSNKIKPNEVERSGKTPLHVAVSDNSLSTNIAHLLIKNNKVDVNVKDSLGLTALHIAVSLNSGENSRHLMARNGIDLYAKDKNGMAPIHYAAMYGYEDIVGGFVAYGMDNLNSPATDKKWTPLHFAVYFKHERLVDGLVGWVQTKGKISVDEPDAQQQTPLHLAAQSGDDKSVDHLAAAGAKTYKKTAEGYTPLAIAIINKKEDTVRDIVSWERTEFQKLPNGTSIKEVDVTACELADEQKFMFDYLVDEGRCDRERWYKIEFEEDSSKYFGAHPDGFDKHHHFDKYTQGAKPEVKGEEFRKFIRDSPRDYYANNEAKTLTNSFKLNEEMEMKDFKTFDHVDVSGALLLLDLLVRKFTNEKYVPNWRYGNSPFEARVQALEITEKLDKVLNEIGSMKRSESLDSFDLYSNVRKAIQSGNDKKFLDTLCSYINEFSSLKPEGVGEVLEVILSNYPKMIISNMNIDQKLQSLIKHSCFQEKF